MKKNALKTSVLTALFAASGVAGGYLLMAVPNIEIITVLMFLAGYTLGLRNGALASTICGILYFGFNPQGMYPPLLAAQILGLICAPLTGWLFEKFMRNKPSRLSITDALMLASFALISTLWYDVLTTLAFPISTGMNFKATLTVLVAGIPFALLHIGGNIVIFLLVIPVLTPQIKSQVSIKSH